MLTVAGEALLQRNIIILSSSISKEVAVRGSFAKLLVYFTRLTRLLTS